jgi:effector-binding domain-containing protein
MELKTTPPVKVMFFTTRTSLEELESFVLKVAEQLYAEIAKQQLIPTGPQYWTYHGLDGKPDTIFTLEICVPVNKAPVEESIFLYKELGAFKCVSILHNGSWDDLAQVYGSAIQNIFAQQKQMNGFYREIYINIDMENPGNNITEVQIGIN